MPQGNPFAPPKASLEGGPPPKLGPVHRHQRAIAAVWLLVGAATCIATLHDLPEFVGLGGMAMWFYVPLALVFLALGSAALVFGRALWMCTGRTLGPGRLVSIAGGLLFGLMCVVNLINGILGGRLSAVLGALLCGAGFWFCVVSLGLCRSYARLRSAQAAPQGRRQLP